MLSAIEAILDNIRDAEEYLVEEDIANFIEIITTADNIFVTGAGRSGLAAKAFAMRLMHLNAGDCILAISGSGETNTIVTAARISKKRGAKVLALTSYPESSLGQLADGIIHVKGRTKVEVDDENYLKRQIKGNYTSLTPLGTAFELTSLVFLDGLVSELMEAMGKTEEDLKNRHTVLE